MRNVAALVLLLATSAQYALGVPVSENGMQLHDREVMDDVVVGESPSSLCRSVKEMLTTTQLGPPLTILKISP